jgi:hypothetical protein
MESDIPFPTFEDVDEAKDSLDTLLHRIAVLSQRFRKNGSGSEVEWSTVSLAHEQITGLLAAWYSTYLRSVPEIESRVAALRQSKHMPLAFGTKSPSIEHPAIREPMAFTLLLLYHSMATVMCACLRSHSESQYEAHTPVFLSMLEHMVNIFEKYSLARTVPHNINLHDSIGEFGFIAPLYFLAMKCRNHRIRLHGIRLLREIPHKEGSWDSFLAANIAHRVMELEEQHVYCRGDVDDNFSLYEVPTLDLGISSSLPKCSMFHDVQVQMRDDHANMAVVTCKRWGGDGSLETTSFQADDKCVPEYEAQRWWAVPPAQTMSLKD